MKLERKDWIAITCLMIALLLTIATLAKADVVDGYTQITSGTTNEVFYYSGVGSEVVCGQLELPTGVTSDNDSIRVVGYSFDNRIWAGGLPFQNICTECAVYSWSGDSLLYESMGEHATGNSACLSAVRQQGFWDFEADDTIYYAQGAVLYVCAWMTDSLSDGRDSYYGQGYTGTSMSYDTIIRPGGINSPATGWPSEFASVSKIGGQMFNVKIRWEYDSTGTDATGRRRRIVVQGSTGGF